MECLAKDANHQSLFVPRTVHGLGNAQQGTETPMTPDEKPIRQVFNSHFDLPAKSHSGSSAKL